MNADCSCSPPEWPWRAFRRRLSGTIDWSDGRGTVSKLRLFLINFYVQLGREHIRLIIGSYGRRASTLGINYV